MENSILPLGFRETFKVHTRGKGGENMTVKLWVNGYEFMTAFLYFCLVMNDQ